MLAFYDRLDRDNFPEGDGPVMRASNIHYELAERTWQLTTVALV